MKRGKRNSEKGIEGTCKDCERSRNHRCKGADEQAILCDCSIHPFAKLLKHDRCEDIILLKAK